MFVNIHHADNFIIKLASGIYLYEVPAFPTQLELYGWSGTINHASIQKLHAVASLLSFCASSYAHASPDFRAVKLAPIGSIREKRACARVFAFNIRASLIRGQRQRRSYFTGQRVTNKGLTAATNARHAPFCGRLPIVSFAAAPNRTEAAIFLSPGSMYVKISISRRCAAGGKCRHVYSFHAA